MMSTHTHTKRHVHELLYLCFMYKYDGIVLTTVPCLCQPLQTVESYFYMWRFTKKEMYRDWAWEVVKKLEKNCRCGSGYCGLNNVDVDAGEGNWHSTQESFFIAETLKYLYVTNLYHEFFFLFFFFVSFSQKTKLINVDRCFSFAGT